MKSKFFLLLIACLGISGYASSGVCIISPSVTPCCNKECASPVTNTEQPVAGTEGMEFSPAGLLLLQI